MRKDGYILLYTIAILTTTPFQANAEQNNSQFQADTKQSYSLLPLTLSITQFKRDKEVRCYLVHVFHSYFFLISPHSLCVGSDESVLSAELVLS